MSTIYKALIICAILVHVFSFVNALSNKRFPFSNDPNSVHQSEWEEDRKGWHKSAHRNATNEDLKNNGNWNGQGLESRSHSHSRHHSADNLEQEESSFNVKGRVHSQSGGHKDEIGEVQQIFRQKSRKFKRVRAFQN